MIPVIPIAALLSTGAALLFAGGTIAKEKYPNDLGGGGSTEKLLPKTLEAIKAYKTIQAGITRVLTSEDWAAVRAQHSFRSKRNGQRIGWALKLALTGGNGTQETLAPSLTKYMGSSDFPFDGHTFDGFSFGSNYQGFSWRNFAYAGIDMDNLNGGNESWIEMNILSLPVIRDIAKAIIVALFSVAGAIAAPFTAGLSIYAAPALGVAIASSISGKENVDMTGLTNEQKVQVEDFIKQIANA